MGEALKKPNWVHSDSKYIDKVFGEHEFDFLLTCPPYADLEVYSDDPDDLSNMDYEDFIKYGKRKGNNYGRTFRST